MSPTTKRKRLHSQSSAFFRKPIPLPECAAPSSAVSLSVHPRASRGTTTSSTRAGSNRASSEPCGSVLTIDTNDREARHRSSSRRRQSYNAIDTNETTSCGEAPPDTDVNVLVDRPGFAHFEIDTGSETALERHLSLIDLLAIGVGGTIGSGLFVLAGLVAHEYAGPSSVVSWAISGCAALLSGCCYAELSARIPLSGGAYAYAFVAMGELPAVLTAACLSLEYLAAASAVARSWGDKVVEWLTEMLGDGHAAVNFLGSSSASFSPLAFLISSGTVVLLLNGVKESKKATNFFTTLKVSLVVFMVLLGFLHVQPSNWVPFVPPQFGYSGILRGATGTFFGYLGYDQVSCLGGEAIDPKRNLPLAILLTIVGVSVTYVLAALSLTGMQNYQEISPVSGFPSAFYDLDLNVAGQITAIGEILTLPIVVLISLMAQPRLQYALADDGLLPQYFRKVDENGNLFNGTLFAGIIMVLIATFVPFTHLNDIISCAVLMALSMTDTSLILLWHESPDVDSHVAEGFLVAFHGGALVASVSMTLFLDTVPGVASTVLGVGCMILAVYGIVVLCPRSATFGGQRLHYHNDELRTDDGYFRTPTPYIPCLGIFVNWYLIAQLDLIGVAGLLGFLGLSVLYYIVYASRHSVWRTAQPAHVKTDEPFLQHAGVSESNFTLD